MKYIINLSSNVMSKESSIMLIKIFISILRNITSHTNRRRSMTSYTISTSAKYQVF